MDDPSSVFHGRVPMPVIMIAQMECILYTKVLRPVHKKLLDQLNFLVKENKKEYWLTIYLTAFILLHSCAMISRRDWETARQYNLKVGLLPACGEHNMYTVFLFLLLPPLLILGSTGRVCQPRKHFQAPERRQRNSSSLSLPEQGGASVSAILRCGRPSGTFQGRGSG